MKRILVLYAILALQTVGTKSQCQNTMNCITTHPRCLIKSIKDASCLSTTLQQLNSSGKTVVVFENTTLTTGLPGGIFKDTAFESVYFRFFDIKTLSSDTESPFYGATKLKKLHFLNPVSNIRSWKFSQLNVLQLTDLVFSRIPEEYIDIYNELPAKFSEAGTDFIRNLEISTSCLYVLQPGSLSTFNNIEKLSLAGNRIQSFSPNVLPPNPTKLKSIDLRANDIHNLEPPEFWNPSLPSLKDVHLEHNLLSTIDSSFLTNNIEKFYINENNVSCCPELAWILKVNPSIWNGPVGSPALCTYPEELEGKTLKTLTEQDLLNADC